MDFLSSGIPLGRYFGINVRLHFTFLLFAFWRLQQFHNLLLGLGFIAGIYLCILLHEFGHALAARWCDGEANDILLWPLGGLAMCRPAFHPTAHLITTVAGPFVTFVLWLGLGFASVTVKHLLPSLIVTREMMMLFSSYNLLLLIFNLVPAFPMDGGRILRDVLWHWMHIERATDIAVFVSRLLAVLIVFLVVVPANAWLEPALRLGLPAALVFFAADLSGDYWMILMAAFIFLQGIRERQYLAYEAGGVYGFSIRDRLRRGRRQRAFKAAVAESGQTSTTTAFHRCAACGRTEHDAPALEFRVCPDCQGGEEYCTEHLEAHQHV